MFTTIIRDCMVTGQYDVSKEIVKILRDYTKVPVFLFEDHGRYYVNDHDLFQGWCDGAISDVIAKGTKFHFYGKLSMTTGMMCEYDALTNTISRLPSFNCHMYTVDISDRYI